MDAVEKALQRSREESPTRASTVPWLQRSSHAAAIASRTHLAPGDNSSGPAPKIAYDQSNVQAVSEKVLRKNRLLAGFHREPVSDTYRMLRVQVLKHLLERGQRALGVCSANSGDGKTLTATNLAISIALDPNHTCLLVDLDLRKPRLHAYFGLDVKKGLCDYLEGNTELSECLINPGIDRLVLLPVRRPVLNSSELLSSQRVSHLLQEIQGRYPDRIIIFDLPPILVTDDSLVVLPQINASLFVVAEGKTLASEIQRGVNLLNDYGLIGTVLNKSSQDRPHAYY